MTSRLALLFASLFASLGLAQRIAPTDAAGGAFSPTGSAITLQVSVTTDSGQPLSGAGVLFVAPSEGPSGEFTIGAGDTQIRVQTGPGGIAATQFYTNAVSGPYLVSAWLEGTTASTHLAITNRASAAAPPLDAAAALASVRNRLPQAPGSVLYGPFLLDPGTLVAPSSSFPPSDPVTIVTQTIFFWIDDNPLAAYDHPVRWVMLDLAAANADPQTFDRLWAPYIVPPGSTGGYGLVPPLFRLDTSAILARPAAGAAAKSRAALRTPSGDGSNTGACAVVVYGPDSEAFAIGAAEMRDVFSDTLNVPDGNIFEDTTPGTLYGVNHQASTPGRLHDLFIKAKAKNCKKLYFYFALTGILTGVSDRGVRQGLRFRLFSVRLTSQ